MSQVRRQGLPRTAGGAPSGGTGEVPEWAIARNTIPAGDRTVAGVAPVAAVSSAPAAVASSPAVEAVAADVPATSSQPELVETAAAEEVAAPAAAAAPRAADVVIPTETAYAPGAPVSLLRRNGLPRAGGASVSGGSGAVPESYVIRELGTITSGVTGGAAAPAAPAAPAVAAEPANDAPVAAVATAVAASAEATAPAQSTPAAAPAAAAPKSPSTTARRNWRIALYALEAAIVAGALIVLVRAWLETPAMQSFLETYPGSYELPESSKPGFPIWLQWSHYLNFFFIVLIVRSGLTSRYEKKPDGFWTSKNPKRSKKVSLTVWFHQSLDLLWFVNGIVFVVLLFATGAWMRIVPTSWEVFPNAFSAALQYVSLEWPEENGWVNYNSLQQLMYFLVVFVAAPLAAATGVRLSTWWNNEWKLSERYPIDTARAIHFPTMLFFVFFVAVHITLVFTTGALKNLNHMFGGGDSDGWFGLIMFMIGLAVIVAAWLFVKPMLLTAIAQRFGTVSRR